MKRFHNDRQIQVYMYAFICVKPETIPEEDNFPDTRTFVEKYKKRSTPGPVPKHQIRFSYICLDYFELDIHFGKKTIKRESENLPNIK